MNGNVRMKAPEETTMDCQNGWYSQLRTQSVAIKLVSTEEQHKDQQMIFADSSRVAVRFQPTALPAMPMGRLLKIYEGCSEQDSQEECQP